jgi:rhodanese-related sulfurtransferase
MAKPYSLSVMDLFARVGTPQAPDIVDVCLDEDHALDPRVIPGSQRMSFQDAAKDARLGRARPCVIACQKGLKLSQGVAALLRAAGGSAMYLEGGMVAWAAADLPAWSTKSSSHIGDTECSWVVPEQLTPDVLLDAWTVSRFVDRAPRWLRVEEPQIALVADRFDAATLDVATHLRQQDGAFQHPFAALEQKVRSDDVATMLRAHCALHLQSNNWLDKIAPAFDALWHDATGGAA